MQDVNELTLNQSDLMGKPSKDELIKAINILNNE